MPGGRMSEVELYDPAAPGPATEPAAPPQHRRQRHLVILGSAVLVVALALVATQVALGARERTAIAHLDGVVDRLDAAPVVLWEALEPTRTPWRGSLGDGSLARASYTEDGTKQLVALDASTGRARWSRTLPGPSASLDGALAAGDAVSDFGSCATAATTGDAPSVVCLVT